MSSLVNQHCKPAHGQTLVTAAAFAQHRPSLHADWQLDATHSQLSRDFKFKNYYETMAFVNALAWMAHHENHHPDLEVGYNHCLVHYTTHDVNGLSENDIICALRADRIAAGA